MMQTDKIFVLDSTLRDGAQGEGISFSVDDKLAILKRLDRFGVDYIEGGNPASNPKDREFFQRARQIPLNNSQLAAFTSTHRPGIHPADDPVIQEALAAETGIITIVGKTWLLHVNQVLACSSEENLYIIDSTIKHLKSKGKRVFFDAEHFFDGYKDNPDYAQKVLETALDAGAECLILCDTNGGTMPLEIADVIARLPQMNLGIHCHNDCGMAVANTIIAVQSGTRHIQGTFGGFGERCGNADLCTIIPNLQLKMGYNCVPPDSLPHLRNASRTINAISNLRNIHNAPYIGRSAFAHKGGMHSDAVAKNPTTFEHVPPEAVGNQRRILMSDVAGRASLMSLLSTVSPDLQKHDEATGRILAKIKEFEHQGYQFEGAEGSLELLIRRELGQYQKHFDLVRFQVTVDEPNQEYSSTAFIKIKSQGIEKISSAEGCGPVDALDTALRRALEKFYPHLTQMRLTDYKVRVLGIGEGTASHVRVLITSTDGDRTWTTIGVSGDIINASWIALLDAVEYFLV